MENIKINNTILSFPKIIYVDNAIGNDENDGGINSPVNTIAKAIELCMVGSAIKLEDGIYNLYKFSDIIINNKGLTLIGNNSDTVVEIEHVPLYENVIPSLEIQIYNCRFRLKATSTGDTRVLFYTNESSNSKIIFHNVAFIKNGTRPTVGFFIWFGSGTINLPRDVVFENCIAVGACFQMNPDYAGTTNIKYINCATDMSSIANRNSFGSLETSLLSVTFDINYNITNKEWKNIGTGLNPDGTQASIGIYGGEFAWGEWKPNFKKKYLIQDNDKIKKPIMEGLQEIGNVPVTLEMFEEHGTEELNDIIGIVNKDVDMIYKEDLEDMKLFRYKLVGYTDIAKLSNKAGD